jgi:hypothetical protein
VPCGNPHAPLQVSEYYCNQNISNPPLDACKGDVTGIGTYARYNTISAIALLFNAAGTETIMYVADQVNNKIRQVNLVSGLYEMTTFSKNVDVTDRNLKGLAIFGSRLFCGITGGVLVYNLTIGSSSRSLYAGNIGGNTGR